ncbi:hypothetical protein EVAR_61483_1 [Eumeta japonica]|uniref:Uncharacterized protein n=1 Tax=Eumeta variegata TaxID=151549 RepID=A0A4C1ZJV5_EUMVA|nr:hypothetical protein EVAR_61483_1 [Eumeta japonica]
MASKRNTGEKKEGSAHSAVGRQAHSINVDALALASESDDDTGNSSDGTSDEPSEISRFDNSSNYRIIRGDIEAGFRY